MKYKVEIKPSVLKSLKKLDVNIKKKMIERIDLLETDPYHRGSLKLSGEEFSYRTRVGKYWIVYEINNSKVFVYVINIDHRKDVYR